MNQEPLTRNRLPVTALNFQIASVKQGGSICMELRIEGLTKVYKGGVRALDNVNLTIPKGLYGLLGPN